MAQVQMTQVQMAQASELASIDVRDVIERVHNLSSKEKLHILNILKIHNKSYTQNANGYFFNMYDVEADVLNKIHKCLELIEQNSDVINEMDRRRDELLAYYKKVIQEKITASLTKLKDDFAKKITLKPCANNINIVVSRKFMIKKKDYGTQDPDVLMKEYASRNVFPKNSIFYRMKTRMKEMSTGRIKHKKEESEKDVDTENLNNDEEGEDNEIEQNDLDNEELQLQDQEDDMDNCEIKSQEEEMSEISDEDSDEEEEESDKGVEKQVMFYKKLLNSSGFVFDEDIRCNLVYQEYIK